MKSIIEQELIKKKLIGYIKFIKMKTNFKNKENLFVLILSRILSFPFFLGLLIVDLLILFLRTVVNYVMYGGEAIAYTKSTTRATIFDIFNKMQNDYYLKKYDKINWDQTDPTRSDFIGNKPTIPKNQYDKMNEDINDI